MNESYGEGVAIHTDPESCGAACKGGVEALTGARAAGYAAEKKPPSGVPTLEGEAEGPTRRIEIARGDGTPRGQRPRARTATPRTRIGKSCVPPRRMTPRDALGSPRADADDARTRKVGQAPPWRHHLRQEPDAGKPLVRIGGGGDG